jgi:hypothetical protein
LNRIARSFPSNISSHYRLALALAIGVTLSACSSTPPDQLPSEQAAPGTASRPVLSAEEAKNFQQARYFTAMDPNAAPWSPYAIRLPAQPNFVVGPAGTQGVTHTSIQAAVDAAIAKHSSSRQYIAIMPGEYEGTVYVPAAPGSVTLYGLGEKPVDVKIGLPIDSEIDTATWRHLVNPGGKYMPGKPAWYMFDRCQSKLQSMFDLFPRLKERRKQRAMTMSGGEQQMLAIARALMSRPKLLLLDEPSLGLAPIVVKQIFQTLRELARNGMTIFLVEQNAHHALKLSDRGYVMVNGQIRLSGSGEELLGNPDVRKAYLGGA